MAMRKYGNASTITKVVDPGKWVDKKVEPSRVKVAKKVISKYDPSNWLLSHATIIASVDVDQKDPNDPKSNYLIKPEYSVFVNNNGDSWERELLINCHESFIGGENYCFPSGTMILMSDGIQKPIEQVNIGDKVINRKGEISKVTNTSNRFANDLVELSGKGLLHRNLFVTKEHPFWVYHAREDCPKTGRPNHFDRDKSFCLLKSWKGFSLGVHTSKEESFGSGLSPLWKEAGELDTNRDFFTHTVSDVEVENIEVNENRAVLIGWFLAEGSYTKTNKSSNEESGVAFHLGNDELDVAEKLKKLLLIEFGDCLRIDCEPRIYETQSGSINLNLCNKKVADYFKKWCGKYSWAKKMPEEAMWLPKNLQSLIFKNCVLGDGSAAVESKGYSIELKSKSLVQQLWWLSLRLGLFGSYKETGVLSRYSDLEIIDGFEVFTDPHTNKKSRPGYKLSLSVRDSKKFDKESNNFDERISSRRSRRYTHIFESEDGKWILSKIESLKPCKVGCQVYNIEVEGDNSYIAEGVVVHNCEHIQIPELSKGKILDVALREVPFMQKDGKDLTTLYADILVATNKKHVDLIQKIKTGEYNAMSMGCFLPGTEVTMADGTKRLIEDIRPGDIVLTHRGRPSEVINLQIRQKNESILKISFEGGCKDIYVTKEHPFWSFKTEHECACGCGETFDVKVRKENKKFRFSPYRQGHHLRSQNKEIKDLESIELGWNKIESLKEGDFLSYPITNVSSYSSYNDGYMLRKIKRVEEIPYEGSVFNMEVEGDNSYIANDVAVHNCLIEYSQCSQCGVIARDETQACKHIRFFKRNFFYDDEGVKRIVAELCGRAEDPKSCRFIEGSWVRKPAFEGAVLRNIIEPSENLGEQYGKIFDIPSAKIEPGSLLRAASLAAEGLVKEIVGAEDEDKKEEAPKSDMDFPEAPDDVDDGLGKEDATPPAEDAPSPEGLPTEDAPAEQPPAVPVPEEDATAKEVKDMLKQQALNEIRKELYEKENNGEGTRTTTPPMDTGIGANDSLVKEASIVSLIKKAKFEGNRKLANGLFILSNLNSWGEFKKYGYSREDLLNILHQVDASTSDNPLDSTFVDALSKIKEASDLQKLFTEVIVETGRKPNTYEAKKIASWAKILTHL